MESGKIKIISDTQRVSGGGIDTEAELRIKRMLWYRQNTWVECPFCHVMNHPCFTEKVIDRPGSALLMTPDETYGLAVMAMCRNEECTQIFDLVDCTLLDEMGCPARLPDELL